MISFLSVTLFTLALYADGTLALHHYQCLHGSGQYPDEGYDLAFPDNIAGKFAIMLLGRAGAGKSRIVERILDTEPNFISSAMGKGFGERFTNHGTVYPRTFGDVELFAADTVGFLNQRYAGLQDVFQSILDNIDCIDRARLPLKRIYFVVGLGFDCLVTVHANLQFLKVALGPQAASEIRFVVNRCDVMHAYDPRVFQRLAEDLGNMYQEVFSTPLPPDRVLYISAEDCMGQLYDDLVDAFHEPSLELTSQAPLPETHVEHLERNDADRLALSPEHRPQLIRDVEQFIREKEETQSGERGSLQAAQTTPPRPATEQPNGAQPQPPPAPNQQEESQTPPPTYQSTNDETAEPVPPAVQDPSANLPPRPEQDPATPNPDSQSTQSSSIPPTSDPNSNNSTTIHAGEQDCNQQPAVAHAVISNAAPEPDAAVQIRQDSHSNPLDQNTMHSVQYSDSNEPEGISTSWVVAIVIFCTLLLLLIATYFLKNRSVR